MHDLIEQGAKTDICVSGANLLHAVAQSKADIYARYDAYKYLIKLFSGLGNQLDSKGKIPSDYFNGKNSGEVVVYDSVIIFVWKKNMATSLFYH